MFRLCWELLRIYLQNTAVLRKNALQRTAALNNQQCQRFRLIHRLKRRDMGIQQMW